MDDPLDKPIALDCEVYPNYFLVSFKGVESGKVQNFEIKSPDECLTKSKRKRLRKIMKLRSTFGFNSNNFDLPLICRAMVGGTADELYRMAEHMIKASNPGWFTMREYDIPEPGFPHFDLMEPAPGVMISLKLYGGRMHSQRLQDLPIEPGATLSPNDMVVTRDYCVNDLDTTIDLYTTIHDQLQLRADMSKEYELNLMSKSDAQIAEAVLKKVNRKGRSKVEEKTTFTYTPPEYIEFTTPQLQDALEVITSQKFSLLGNGAVAMPDALKSMKIRVGKAEYKLGIGGLHSTEKRQAVVPGDGEILADRDVASYYPSIILNLGLYPPQFGKRFLTSYKEIVDTRLAAKARGDKIVANSLKITINGSFGKMGSKWSALYAPNLMLTVTMTGQLSLLMLIERLEMVGIRVVSANTDGFVTLVPKGRYAEYDDICQDWEMDTNFELEETRYKALYSRDINNYIAVTDYGTKAKGAYAAPGLMKNPQTVVCNEAVTAYLTTGRAIRSHIEDEDDIKKFITVRRVNGGAVWKNEYLGRVVRWVYSPKGEQISYLTNGNKVAGSDGAWPVMDFTTRQPPLDIDKYVEISEGILKDIGVTDG